MTRMFLQTKCVIWVKPKRSFSRGKRERASVKTLSWSNSFSGGPHTNREKVIQLTKLLIPEEVSFGNHLK